MSHVASGIVGGLLFFAVGLVLALNPGGFTDWHARVSYHSVSFLKHVPPWRWLVKADEQTLMKRQVRRMRFVGVIFATVGIGIAVSSIVQAL